MPLSRLRLRLAGGFALAFALALALLAAGALGYLWRESTHRLDTRLAAVADGVAHAVAGELNDAPNSPFSSAVSEAVNELPANGDAFAIVDSAGLFAGGVNQFQALDGVLGAWARAGKPVSFRGHVAHTDFRAAAIPSASFHVGKRGWRFGVVAYASTEGIEADTELLGGALAIAAPLIVLLSLVAGYLLAGRALGPVRELGASVAAIAPNDLSQRLPVVESHSEIAALAGEFNALLERLDAAQRRNRQFVREAAHQIRTPLTLVLGEAGHELTATDSSSERMRATLGRIRLAAEQMRRRVDELFLLAEAEAGVKIRLEDDVELDGLVLECTDLMRGRATSLQRTLALGEVQPVTVRGNGPLLREAMLELIENGCRHGSASAPVTTEVRVSGDEARIEVRSAVAPAAPADVQGRGLGVSIVTWIAAGHGGRFETDRTPGVHVSRLVLPVLSRA